MDALQIRGKTRRDGRVQARGGKSTGLELQHFENEVIHNFSTLNCFVTVSQTILSGKYPRIPELAKLACLSLLRRFGPMPDLREQLQHEILAARSRIYAAAGPTPLDEVAGPGGCSIFLKREDQSPIHAYKWRGAFNRIACLTPEEKAKGVVTASAGNHAQGVALAARHMGLKAAIYMPVSTPRMKQQAVRKHGGDAVEIILTGDTFDAAAEAARAEVARSGKPYIHPYDDLTVMGGQGTLADEIVMSGKGPFDVAYLQIGGGGMAAGVACWLRYYFPGIRLVGVEGVEQASMKAALAAGKPVTLDYVDVFCDGTAVRRAGDLTFQLCRDLLDEIVTVTNNEVCAGIQWLWEQRRCVPEPAGAMGVAAMLREMPQLAGQKALVIVCGANMDFSQLANVARLAGIGGASKRLLRFTIGERAGSLLDLLEKHLSGVNITEFQYGMSSAAAAWPVIGVDAPAPVMDKLLETLRADGVEFEDVTLQDDVDFRVIRYDPALLRHPLFLKLEFPERPGALHDFLASARNLASISYFNYSYSGERVGRALIGFDFPSAEARGAFRAFLTQKSGSFRACRELSPAATARMLRVG